MRQTLFFIPDKVGSLEVFGFGWLLIVWMLISAFMVFRVLRRPNGRSEVTGLLPMVVIVALAILFLIPRIEQEIPPGFATFPSVDAERGLPIRGYGVMLLLAVLAAVGIALRRSQQAGLNPDIVFGLGFTVIISGIVGARLFFITQYWELIRGDTLFQTLGNMVSVVNGGLVVYGSLIGAAVGFLFYCYRHRLHPLALGDLIAPSLALGLAIGRIGCLLNGCCFGGPCQIDYPWAVTFPADSPPYVHQKSAGLLHGLELGQDPNGRVVISRWDPPQAGDPVEPAVGESILKINGIEIQDLPHARAVLERVGPELMVTFSDGREVSWSIEELPPRSLPVHPTQIYSAINATLLFLVTMAYFPFRQRHGQVIALLLSLYAITRFLLELIRTDELAFAAQMTISQNVSVWIAIGMVILWVYIMRQPKMLDAS